MLSEKSIRERKKGEIEATFSCFGHKMHAPRRVNKKRKDLGFLRTDHAVKGVELVKKEGVSMGRK